MVAPGGLEHVAPSSLPKCETTGSHDGEAGEEEDDEKVPLGLWQRQVLAMGGRGMDQPDGSGAYDASRRHMIRRGAWSRQTLGDRLGAGRCGGTGAGEHEQG